MGFHAIKYFRKAQKENSELIFFFVFYFILFYSIYIFFCSFFFVLFCSFFFSFFFFSWCVWRRFNLFDILQRRRRRKKTKTFRSEAKETSLRQLMISSCIWLWKVYLVHRYDKLLEWEERKWVGNKRPEEERKAKKNKKQNSHLLPF